MLCYEERRLFIPKKLLVFLCFYKLINFVFLRVIDVSVCLLREHIVKVSIEILFEREGKIVLKFSESDCWQLLAF